MWYGICKFLISLWIYYVICKGNVKLRLKKRWKNKGICSVFGILIVCILDIIGEWECRCGCVLFFIDGYKFGRLFDRGL